MPTNSSFYPIHVPSNILASIETWILYGNRIKPGSFLRSIIANDLAAACACADSKSARSLWAIVHHLASECPRDCWGSPEALNTWRGTEPEDR